MKFIFLIIYITSFIYADSVYEGLLYDKIFPIIFKKDKIKVYGSKKDIVIFLKNSKFIIVKECNNSDMIFGNIIVKKECKNIPRFVKSYKFYKTMPNVIGALYWRKGRPQLQLNKENIYEDKLYLPKILKKYAQ